MRMRQFHSNVLIGNARVKAPLERSVPQCIPRGAQAPTICSAPVLVGFEYNALSAVSARMRGACMPSNSRAFPTRQTPAAFRISRQCGLSVTAIHAKSCHIAEVNQGFVT
jgi:hypothetical protein